MANWVNPCKNCPQKYKAIGGDGPRPAPVLAIMERPGQDENRNGRVACGKTGQELDELYLPLAGLDRSEIRVCNSVLCGADNNKTPSPKDVLACASQHLPDEIERTNPDVILLLGSSACSLVPGIRLDLHHGIPQPTSKVGDLFGWHGWLVPMYHPSIGLHESRWMKICMDDWDVIQNYGTFGVDPIPARVNYKERLHEYLDCYPACLEVAIDTESHGGVPWSIQLSHTPGTGVLVRTNDNARMDEIRRWAQATSAEFIFHNAAYDMEVLRRLGIHIPMIRDTMQEAFHLGNLPQGLKALAYRLFRHTMTSYAETVRPASIFALVSWMTEAFCIAQNDLSFVERRKLKTKVKAIVHKGELESLLARLLRLTDAASEYDPWERLDAFWYDPVNDWIRDHVETRIGAYPILGIANCRMEDAIQYAVGDADWTGQVAVELERRRATAFKIHPGDIDA
jgi:uracil-DNA glycosylase family 4